MPIRHILVPIDGSTISARALDFAIARANVYGADITVAFAVNLVPIETALAAPYGYFDPTPLVDALESEAAAILDAGERQAKAAGVPVRQVKLDGPAGPAITRYAREAKIDAIVLGTSGRRGFDRLAIGSTAVDVVRSCNVPVFVVPKPEGAPPTGTLKHILVAIDGSPSSDAGLAIACELAKAEGARATLCSVVESEHAESAAKEILAVNLERIRALGASADSKILHGDACEQIVKTARVEHADVVVMGTHGRAGIPRFVLGSVAEGVLRSASIPVCTIRHQGTGS
jgi:nucleotide-binding universal stress UspA family protein